MYNTYVYLWYVWTYLTFIINPLSSPHSQKACQKNKYIKYNIRGVTAQTVNTCPYYNKIDAQDGRYETSRWTDCMNEGRDDLAVDNIDSDALKYVRVREKRLSRKLCRPNMKQEY